MVLHRRGSLLRRRTSNQMIDDTPFFESHTTASDWVLFVPFMFCSLPFAPPALLQSCHACLPHSAFRSQINQNQARRGLPIIRYLLSLSATSWLISWLRTFISSTAFSMLKRYLAGSVAQRW
jgi:hypothetical protein